MSKTVSMKVPEYSREAVEKMKQQGWEVNHFYWIHFLKKDVCSFAFCYTDSEINDDSSLLNGGSK